MFVGFLESILLLYAPYHFKEKRTTNGAGSQITDKLCNVKINVKILKYTTYIDKS